MSAQPKKRKRRWPIWVFAILLLLAVLVVAGYWFAKRTAASDIAKQLDALEVGPHEIGSVSVGLNGVVANDIEFFKEGESKEQPWLTVDRLTVEHPILELAQGASSYNAIELAGVKATLESASLFESDPDGAELNLSELELPAKQLRLKDAQVVIVDAGKPDLTIDGIQLQLDQNENDAAVAITGEVGDLLGSKVDIAGELAANREQLNLTMTADEFNVATQQWQNLPGVPQGMEKNITADGKLIAFGCDVTLKNDDLIVDGSAEVDGLEIGLPQFDLPVSVSQGSINFDAQKVELTELVAKIDGSGDVQGKADASFAEFPIEVTFDTQFQNVVAASLRKIVVAIPEILNAEADGTARGTVTTEASTRTTINITADAAGTNGTYGQIKAKTLGANVVIENLIFDDQLNYESIDGVVNATAQTEQQSVPDVLTTFELDSFQQQMQIVGNASGAMNLQMPLATAEDMRSWKLKIEGGVPEGSVSGKQFVDAQAVVEMVDGILQFNPVNVLAVADNVPAEGMAADAASNLQLNVRWPMVPETTQGDNASIVVSGADVPVTWLMDFLQNQIANSTTEPAQPNVANQPNAATSPNAMARVDQLSGTAAFEATLTLPVATPDDIYTWQVDGTIRDSKIKADNEQLQDLAGSIQMNDGQLAVKNFTGNFYSQSAPNGSVAGDATVNLKEPSQASADLNLTQLPLPWLVSVARETLPQYAEQLQQPQVDSLAGQIDADIKYRTSPVAPTQSLELAVRSAEMSISGQQLRDFNLNGTFDGKQVKVVQLASRVGDSGQLNGQGDWSIETNQAVANLNLKQLPLPWLVSTAQEMLPELNEELQKPPIQSLVGQIDADIRYRGLLDVAPIQSLDLSLSSAQIELSGQQLRDFKLDGSFDGKEIKVTDLKSRIGENGELSAQGTWLTETNQVVGNLDSKQLPSAWLVSITQQMVPELADQLQQPPIKSLAGRINAQVKYQGTIDVAPVESLELSLSSAQFSVSGQKLRNLNLDGSFDGKLIKVTKLTSRIGESGDGGKLDAQGEWSVETNQATGDLEWDGISIATLAAFSSDVPSSIAGNSNGKLTISTLAADQADQANGMNYDIAGAIGVKDLQVQQFKARDIGFDVATQDGNLLLENFRNANRKLGIDLGGKIGLTAPYRFEASGKVSKLPLSQLLSSFTSVDDQVETASLTGVLQGDFSVAGQVENFDWQTDGKVDWLRPTYNGAPLEDIKANWDLKASQWDQAKFTFEAFDGSIDLIELENLPGSIRLKMRDVDAAQLATVAELPTKVAGKINGDLLLKNWDQEEGHSADLSIKGKTIGVGAADLGNFELTANYQDDALKYELAGSIFAGKLTGTGSTNLKETDSATLSLPLKVSLINASVDSLKAIVNSPSLRPLTGRLSAQADIELGFDGMIAADGRIGIDQAKWDSQLITRQGSVHFRVTNEQLLLDELDIDLKRGTIAGRVVMPLVGGAAGRYELSVRNLDLERLTEIYADDVMAHGLLDGRLNGQIGKQITGRGFVGVHQASVNGVAGQSLRLPIQFNVGANTGAGKIELRRSSFRIFDGNASGRAELSFGNTLNVDVDMNFSNVDTEKMLAEVAGISQADQGKLTGKLKLSGRGVRSTRNLKGSFKGSLQRASAFGLPVVSDIARLISVTNLQSTNFDSDTIELLLNNNAIEVRQLNFSSSLVKIAITGKAFLDGRLDLSAASRVETLQQPTLLDELAGSPLANLSPLGNFARLTEFLSDRIVFLKIGGTFDRPQVRVDTQQQLPAEVIRYFLPGSNFLPSPGDLNN